MNETVIQTPPTLEDLRTRRDDILALAERYGAYNIRVFGSVARGEATPESDFDLLVTARPGTSMFEIVGLWLDLKDLLGREVSLITDGIDDQRFLRGIQRDLITL